MNQSEPDDRPHGLRRLPKRPQSAASDAGDVERLKDMPSALRSRPELYFEQLPEPWTEEILEPEEHRIPPDPPSTELADDMGYVTEEPSFYFRHAVPGHRLDDASVEPVRGEVPDYRNLSSSSIQPVIPAPAAPNLPVQRELQKDDRTSVDDYRPSGSLEAVQFRDVSGDPKPAVSRPVQSRPKRLSGQFSAAQPSGEFPAVRHSESMSVPLMSGQASAARTSSETATVSRPVAAKSQGASEERPRMSSEVRVETVRDEAPPPQSQDASNPPAQKSKGGKGKAILGMALASAALVAYAFQIGTLESAADAAAGRLSTGGSVLSSLLPWLLVIPAVLLFGVIVWLLAGIIGLRRTGKKARAPREHKRPKSPLNQFKDAALRQGVDNRTAYRGWRLLEAACGNDRPITVDSLLTYDLELSPKEIRAVHLQLLSDVLRVSNPAMRLPPAETVLDLLKAVDAAPVARPSTASGDVVIPGDPGQRKQTKG